MKIDNASGNALKVLSTSKKCCQALVDHSWPKVFSISLRDSWDGRLAVIGEYLTAVRSFSCAIQR